METIPAYLHWMMRVISFHCKRHLRDFTNIEVTRFLGHMAQTDSVRRLRSSTSGRQPPRRL